MRYLFVLLLVLFLKPLSAQFAFELKVTYAMRIQNSDQYSVSGELISGRVENGKTYYLENGTKIEVKNLMSAKTATSVPVASVPESVSIGITSKDFEPEPRMILRGISTRPVYGGTIAQSRIDKSPEGVLTCKINGKMYSAMTISKPVYIRNSNILDLFFKAEDETVVWLQINGFSDIDNTPHQCKSDTSNKDHSMVCKVAYMPKGFRPTDMPNNYMAYEDLKGNASIMITALDKHKKRIVLEFNGILRPNARLLEEGKVPGLFYISEGRVDNISWDEF